MAVDKLRARCEEMLSGGERIVLDAECSITREGSFPFPTLGSGRAFLTTGRLIWIRRNTPPPLDLLLPMMRIPTMIEFSPSSLQAARRERWGFVFLVRLEVDGKAHFLRLGTGPYPFLRRNPETSEEWMREITGFQLRLMNAAAKVGKETDG